MSKPDLTATARALARHDAIAHDLAIQASPVLRERLAQTQREVLSASGAASIEQARTMLPPRHTPAPAARRWATAAVPVPRTGSRRTTPRGTGQARAATDRAAAGARRRTPPEAPPRPRSPLEQANRDRQDAQRREARRLAALPRSARQPAQPACPVCGNHDRHLCGSQWRLGNGQPLGPVAKRSRRRCASVWTVRGGLPTLGKRAR